MNVPYSPDSQTPLELPPRTLIGRNRAEESAHHPNPESVGLITTGLSGIAYPATAVLFPLVPGRKAWPALPKNSGPKLPPNHLSAALRQLPADRKECAHLAPAIPQPAARAP